MQIAPIFDQDHNSMENYYYFENAFTENEVQQIITEAESKELERGNTFGLDIRKSSISWLNHNEQWIWLYDRMSNMAITANAEMYRFNLYSVQDSIQYTIYDSSEEGHYGAHIDIGPGTASLRKISVVTQLSKPDEYEGGDLQILMGEDNWVNVPRGLGLTVCFPSFLYHRVTPVTKGIRKSLVLWVGGEHFK